MPNDGVVGDSEPWTLKLAWWSILTSGLHVSNRYLDGHDEYGVA